MSEAEKSENQPPPAGTPAPEPAAASEGQTQAQGHEGPRHGGRRSRFRRGGRGGRGRGGRGSEVRGGGGGGGPEREHEHRGEGHEAPVRAESGPEQPRLEERKSSSSIRRAIEQVLHVRTELRRVLEEIQVILRVLDQAEREKTASEDEIEMLRESLRGLHREPPVYQRHRGGGHGGGGGGGARHAAPAPPVTSEPEPEPVEGSEAQAEEENEDGED